MGRSTSRGEHAFGPLEKRTDYEGCHLLDVSALLLVVGWHDTAGHVPVALPVQDTPALLLQDPALYNT